MHTSHLHKSDRIQFIAVSTAPGLTPILSRDLHPGGVDLSCCVTTSITHRTNVQPQDCTGPEDYEKQMWPMWFLAAWVAEQLSVPPYTTLLRQKQKKNQKKPVSKVSDGLQQKPCPHVSVCRQRCSLVLVQQCSSLPASSVSDRCNRWAVNSTQRQIVHRPS